jgi:hypothetical protein
VLIEDALAGGEEAERLGDALPLDAAPVHFAARARGPADAGLREAAALFAEAGCDGIIGCGGARTLDLARLLGGSGAPVITVPTGTESVGLGPFAVAFARHAARQAFIPSAILCDATLTTAAGPAATAAAGMDALVHCLEAYLSTAYNPPADGIALDGLRRAALNLEAAVEDGRNLHARRELLAAALNAGLAAQKGFGGIEAAARGLEAEAGTSRPARGAARRDPARGAGLQRTGGLGPVRGDRGGARRRATADVARTAEPARGTGGPARAPVVGGHRRAGAAAGRARRRGRPGEPDESAARDASRLSEDHGGGAVTGSLRTAGPQMFCACADSRVTCRADT